MARTYRRAWAMAAVLSVAACGWASVREDFSRYEIILEKKPFGDMPPPAVAGAGGVPAAPSFTKELKICAFTSTSAGVTVGIINNGIKPPKSYLMRVGDTQDDITLVDADYDREAALFRKGAEQEWMYLNPASTPMVPAARVAVAPNLAPTPAVVNSPISYAERLRRRREAVKEERKFEPQKLTGEELRQHLKQYQMELIRAGGTMGPPLPLPLTREMDDQLVNEGVLPPAGEVDEDEDEDEAAPPAAAPLPVPPQNDDDEDE